ncbi:MAG TPA: polyphenol oxidase family protein [Acidimicrobiales bacterium]|nr:polyphenol oxidase family protein [Acidimicrobiales bacterium]
MRLGAAEVRFTTTSDGDFSPPDATDDAALSARRRSVYDAPWTWLRQRHGREVVSVEEPGTHTGALADAAVAFVRNAPVAVVTADCAPIICVATDGSSVAAVHAGWRGLMLGVVEATVEIMRARCDGGVVAALGPCVHAECYEFGATDLAPMVDAFGDEVRGVTEQGAPALDLPQAVRVALSRLDVELVHDEDACTSCASGYWSHRARRDAQRQASVAWLV